jgi:hypothetical protein
MSRWLGALLGGSIALAVAVGGQASHALAEEPIVLLEDPVLVPLEWRITPVDDAFTKLPDGQLNDPFHGRGQLEDPWSSAASAAKVTFPETQCQCRCADVLVPSDWR